MHISAMPPVSCC